MYLFDSILFFFGDANIFYFYNFVSAYLFCSLLKTSFKFAVSFWFLVKFN